MRQRGTGESDRGEGERKRGPSTVKERGRREREKENCLGAIN